ncbi:hypothetical protein LEP1GSC163_2750 [Leptospira santarosai str. CBC379]|uniref:Uncharacterized protein n=1 Tax=Leptospira santarosai str. MOR084 TaxID=1049984 RepID=A0A0E2BDS4_9LEPT|nr:hypothetical protein LEP1GSC179_2477 [Leptospira santarosai str. MOR084]EKR92321.1 hypothetical protein LEP1GSC163_2750 [Leptospira santarosai str. CBC379]
MMDKYYSEIPDKLLEKITPLLPKEKPKAQGGRNRVSTKLVMAGSIE